MSTGIAAGRLARSHARRSRASRVPSSLASEIRLLSVSLSTMGPAEVASKLSELAETAAAAADSAGEASERASFPELSLDLIAEVGRWLTPPAMRRLRRVSRTWQAALSGTAVWRSMGAALFAAPLRARTARVGAGVSVRPVPFCPLRSPSWEQLCEWRGRDVAAVGTAGGAAGAGEEEEEEERGRAREEAERLSAVRRALVENSRDHVTAALRPPRCVRRAATYASLPPTGAASSRPVEQPALAGAGGEAVTGTARRAHHRGACRVRRGSRARRCVRRGRRR